MRKQARGGVPVFVGGATTVGSALGEGGAEAEGSAEGCANGDGAAEPEGAADVEDADDALVPADSCAVRGTGGLKQTLGGASAQALGSERPATAEATNNARRRKIALRLSASSSKPPASSS
jgi:hypothetical protein